MNTDKEQLENLCDTGNILLTLADKRKSLIIEMEAQGLSPLQIYERLEIPAYDTSSQRLEADIARCEMVSSALKWYEAEGVMLDEEITVFYFDWDEGVCECIASTLLFDRVYMGQKFVSSPEAVIPEILQPLMDKAIGEHDTDAIEQLSEAMVYVITNILTDESEG